MFKELQSFRIDCRQIKSRGGKKCRNKATRQQIEIGWKIGSGRGRGRVWSAQGIKKKLRREKKIAEGACKRGFVKLLTNKSLAGAAVLRVKE